MKYTLYGLVLGAGILVAGACSSSKKEITSATDILDNASLELERSLVSLNDTSLSPRNLENGTLKLVPSRDWTSGRHHLRRRSHNNLALDGRPPK